MVYLLPILGSKENKKSRDTMRGEPQEVYLLTTTKYQIRLLTMSSSKVIIYGGMGGLGQAIVSHFKSKGWWVMSLDTKSNENADSNVIVDTTMDWLQQEKFVTQSVSGALSDSKVDAIINVAGGWAGGSANSKDFIKNADLMWKQSVWSSSIASALATQHLKPGGLLVLPGAQAALKGTAGMMGYGMAKAAVHQLIQSLSDPKSGLPEKVVTLGLLPITLDTPMNRKFMPKADFSTWTSLEYVSDTLFKWSLNQERPSNDFTLFFIFFFKNVGKSPSQH
ncbi:QDPR [Lepeophtheirus salmonis]|uniref:Dihydropteridine reductase n=1 Tax=Lepeophtheirus salmonis TaxID=72036 RepID=A0A7R8H0B8_LEPSM|nr:QDPR [Lepeophtheirus salmonis]CAF2767013.1 QDPR [Lepeophtheirus salmonis]